MNEELVDMGSFPNYKLDPIMEGVPKSVRSILRARAQSETIAELREKHRAEYEEIYAIKKRQMVLRWREGRIGQTRHIRPTPSN